MGVKCISMQIHCCLNFLLHYDKRALHKLKGKYIISVIWAQTACSSGLIHLCPIIFEEHISKFILKQHNSYLAIAYNKYHFFPYRRTLEQKQFFSLLSPFSTFLFFQCVYLPIIDKVLQAIRHSLVGWPLQRRFLKEIKKINHHTFLSLKFPKKKYKVNIHTLKIKYFKFFDSS